jgi:hypothetical protein
MEKIGSNDKFLTYAMGVCSVEGGGGVKDGQSIPPPRLDFQNSYNLILSIKIY